MWNGVGVRILVIAAGMALGLTLLTAACSPPGSDRSQAYSSAPTTPGKQQLWDPCRLSSRALTAAGVRPDTKDVTPSEIPNYVFWRGCAWHGATYFLSVFSTAHTVDEFRVNKAYENVRDVTIADRRAIAFDIPQPPPNCSVALATTKGAVQILLRQSVGSGPSGDLCPLTLHSAAALSPEIPR